MTGSLFDDPATRALLWLHKATRGTPSAASYRPGAGERGSAERTSRSAGHGGQKAPARERARTP